MSRLFGWPVRTTSRTKSEIPRSRLRKSAASVLSSSSVGASRVAVPPRPPRRCALGRSHPPSSSLALVALRRWEASTLARALASLRAAMPASSAARPTARSASAVSAPLRLASAFTRMALVHALHVLWQSIAALAMSATSWSVPPGCLPPTAVVSRPTAWPRLDCSSPQASVVLPAAGPGFVASPILTMAFRPGPARASLRADGPCEARGNRLQERFHGA
jgi:hypothetical protein